MSDKHASVNSSVTFAKIVSGDSSNSQTELEKPTNPVIPMTDREKGISAKGVEDWPTLDVAIQQHEENDCAKSVIAGKMQKNAEQEKSKMETNNQKGEVTNKVFTNLIPYSRDNFTLESGENHTDFMIFRLF